MSPGHRAMETTSPQLPTGCIFWGGPKGDLAAPHCTPITSGGGVGWPLCLPTPSPVAPNLLGHSTSPQTGWTGCWDGASRGQTSPWPLMRLCYSWERAEAKYGQAETGTGSRPTCAVGPKPWGGPCRVHVGAGTLGSLIVGGAEPQGHWHRSRQAHVGLGAAVAPSAGSGPHPAQRWAQGDEEVSGPEEMGRGC